MIHVALAFGTAFGIQRSGWAIARSGCWSMLKGGFVLNISGPVELYLEVSFHFFIIISHCSYSITILKQNKMY